MGSFRIRGFKSNQITCKKPLCGRDAARYYESRRNSAPIFTNRSKNLLSAPGRISDRAEGPAVFAVCQVKGVRILRVAACGGICVPIRQQYRRPVLFDF